MGGDDNWRMPDDRPSPVGAGGALRLSDWGLILAQGPDAASFLNGQLTQDMLHLDGRARLAGYCSPKGRLLATFVVWQIAPETVALACSADLLAPTLKRLSMYVLRAKCKLSDGSADWPLYGLAGPSADALLRDRLPATDGACARNGDTYLVRLPSADGVSRCLWAGAAPPDLPTLAAESWRWLELRSGVPRVVAATADRFVPQMLNLELLGGVNFQKGCYPGQEVVARSQYRGTIKRRTYLMHSAAPLAAGIEVVPQRGPRPARRHGGAGRLRARRTAWRAGGAEDGGAAGRYAACRQRGGPAAARGPPALRAGDAGRLTRAQCARHLHVRDAGFLEDLAPAHETRAVVEAGGAGLRVQQHFAVAATSGGIDQRVEQRAADPALRIGSTAMRPTLATRVSCSSSLPVPRAMPKRL